MIYLDLVYFKHVIELKTDYFQLNIIEVYVRHSNAH